MNTNVERKWKKNQYVWFIIYHTKLKLLFCVHVCGEHGIFLLDNLPYAIFIQKKSDLTVV